MLNRIRSRFAGTAQVHASSKIGQAAEAAHTFLKAFHRGGVDHGAVLSFGNTITCHDGFTADEPTLHAAVDAVETACRDGSEGTALYDAVAHTADGFVASAAAYRPWLAIFVTDGKDQSSSRFTSPHLAGRYYASQMAKAGASVSFLIAVGSDGELDIPALQALASSGGMHLLRANHMSELAQMLLVLTTKIRTEIQIEEARAGNVTVRRVTPQASVSVTPFMYALVIDRSGSMR